MAANSGVLYITYVEKQGAFLRIWGQIDKNLPTIIERSLKQMSTQFEQGHFVPSVESIQVGILCCAKYKDGCYYRARISNTLMLQQNVVEVQFIDYGNKDIIPVVNLRTIASFAPGLITIPPQARDFILANVTHHGVAWDNGTIVLITNEIRYLDLQWIAISQVANITLIKLYKNGEDVALNLFNRGLVLSIATNAQNMILQSTASTNTSPPYQISSSPISSAVVTPSPPPVVQALSTPPPALLTYKAFTIEPGTENQVYVSYVSDGPCQFSVQLQKMEDSLARLMKELNRMPLQPLEDNPLPGTVCVARCIEDDHICRAVVTSMVDSRYKVFYVDFGNTEIVPIDNLYQIPFKYVIPKVMAMRYALASLERSSMTLEMKCAFKDFVSDKLLRMRTLPPPTRSALPLCSLWDSNNINVLDVLQRAALLAYPEAVQLTRGFSQEVRVSYVHSCSHFYVQIKTKEEDLRRVMAELQQNCPDSDQLQPSEIKTGQPCCALFDADGQWYRAQIINNEGDIVKVRYVDYGNEELVSVSNLRMPRGELLTALRPQALECCLNGYQNMEDDLERDNILEGLILEKEFTMKVIEMQGNRALVELNDQSRYNVGSLLLEKLASAHSQVSPLLIQDSHHIEQRKRKSPTGNRGFSQNFRMDRKPSRDQNEGWTDESNNKNWTSPKQASNNKGWTSPKPTSNDKGWSSPKQTNDKGWNRQDSWRQTRKDGSFDKNRSDSFDKNRSDSFDKNRSDSFDKSRSDSFDQGRGGRRDGFKKDNWGGGNEPQWKRNARSPNQKEGSEKSWSDGSEKNWRRNTRGGNAQNDDNRPRRKFDAGGRSGSSWKSSNQDNISSGSQNLAKVTDPAPSTATFIFPELDGKCEKVLISWFHNPSHFFCQLLEFQSEFRAMMEEIQNIYCKIKPEPVCVGAPAIALFPEDGVRYRARILKAQGAQYHVEYVDFGNVSTVDQVWPIENKFMQLPAQAISCGLNGLVPLENDWPNPDMYSTYFDKESFACTFILSENEKYFVDLTCDEQNVSEVLVSAGLATFQQDTSQVNFDSAILLGQQMRVTVGEIQGLDSFQVQLQNGLYLLCTMHNLESATEKFEDTLKQYSGCIGIMYIDNVLEEKLDVTLYDTNGTKLKIIEPDEGAYETIEALCPLPVFYSTMNGWISHLGPINEDKRQLFVQPSEFADTLAQLLDSLFNHYDATTFDTSLKLEIDLFYAVHSTDGNWYRGQITSIEGEDVMVTFIDYGNSESVPNTEIRELSKEFIELHMLALEVTASGVDETFTEQEINANVWYEETCWKAEILKIDQSATANQAQVEEPVPLETIPTINEKLVQSDEEQITTEVYLEPQIDQSTQIGVSVILSHVDSPSEFYLQLSEAVNAINNLQAALQEQAESFPDLENPAAGVLCAAPYSLDQQWYRSQVLDADSDITTVRFVDYGNTDVLSNETTHVKTLPPDLLSLEQHARRCSLILKAIDTEWSPAACERFEALTNSTNLTAEIIHQDEKTTFIELYASGVNVAETLLQENLAIKLQLETESSCTGYVSNLNSPSEFWVQLENSVADLEWIAEQLSNTENFPELEDLTPGSLCAALFPDDEMWYRARILSNTVAGLEVLFIDYGNSCTCTGLRQLPEDLIMLQALAQKCSLQKPTGILQWSTEATEEFKNISADGATIFTIDKLTTGETSVVRLLLDGEDMAIKLLAKMHDARISHFESVFDFWLQKTEDISKLDAITEKLIEAPNWNKYEKKESESELVAALFGNDEKWYRAKILSENDSVFEVLLVDYGNTATTNDVRILPCDIGEESHLAAKYKLDPLPGFRWSDESSKQLAVINKEGTTIFQVEFVSGDVVRLYVNGNDIRSDLDSICVSSAQNTPRKSMEKKSDDVTPRDIDKYIHSELLTVSSVENDGLIVETAQNYENNEDQKDVQDDLIVETAHNYENNEDQKDVQDDLIVETARNYENNEDQKDVQDNDTDKAVNVEAAGDSEEVCVKETEVNLTNEPSGDKNISTDSLEISDIKSEEYSLEPSQQTSDIDSNTNIESEPFGDTNVSVNSQESLDLKTDYCGSENVSKTSGFYSSDDDLKKTQVCDSPTQNTEINLTTEGKEHIENVINEPSTEIKMTTNIENDVINEPSTEIKMTTNIENVKEPSEESDKLDNSIDVPQRRSSTPHCEKIVPGSVCRGDLTEIPTTDNIQKATSLENLHEPENNENLNESENNKNLQCSTPAAKKTSKELPEEVSSDVSFCKLTTDERIVPGSVSRGETPEPENNENLNESENNENFQCSTPAAEKTSKELPEDVSSDVSFCKLTADERIVPGSVSRGETPEPAENETGNIVSGAVNGLQVNNDSLT